MSSGGATPTSLSPSSTPLAQFQNIPKIGAGTIIPNRVFVGGFAANTRDEELKEYFSHFGAVRDTKIIHDRAGVSKGYGFVTFETQDDAEKIINKESQNLILKDRKLNIGPAIKKQQAFPRLFESVGASSANPVMFTNGAVPYIYQNGVAVFNSNDASSFSSIQQAQPQAAAYPTMMMPTPQVAFLSQSPYQYQAPAAGQQWNGNWATRWATQNPMAGGPGYVYPLPTADMMYAHAPPQGYIDMSDGTMVESAHTENRTCRCASIAAYQRTTFSEQNCTAPFQANLAMKGLGAGLTSPTTGASCPCMAHLGMATHGVPLQYHGKLQEKDSNSYWSFRFPTPPTTPKT